MYETDKKCPECNGEVEYDLACHTYLSTWQGKETWMACMPCDSATEYICSAHNEDRCDSDCYEYEYHDGCGWRWTKNLNKSNPRSVDNETKNPHWND